MKLSDRVFLWIVLAVVFFYCISLNFNVTTLRHDVTKLQIKSEIYQAKINAIISATYKSLNKLMLQDLNTARNVDALTDAVSVIERVIKQYVLPPSYDKVRRANYLIINNSKGYSGSGTLIKYKDRYYILTCAHLLKDTSDLMIAKNTATNTTHLLSLIKVDFKKDLAVYDIIVSESSKKFALPLSDKTPPVGSSIYVIGNPSSYTDILTKGVISKYQGDTGMATATVFFGNSGGAILYSSKVVGVTSRILIMLQKEEVHSEDPIDSITPYYVDAHFAIFVSLDTIKKFLHEALL